MMQVVRQFLAYVLSAAIVVATPGVSWGQTPQPAPAAKPATAAANVAPDAGSPWPRVVNSNGATISIYQPQVDSWTGNVLKAYTAVKVKTAGKQATDYGVIWFTANTEVDKVNRVVTLTNFTITKQNFPTIANNGQAFASALTGQLPWNQTIPLDLLESDLAINGNAGTMKTYEVQNAPPRLIYSTTPAVLALIDGKPVLGTEKDHLQSVINTRALIVYDTSKYTYYLALMDGWMEAPTIEGPYTIARHAPTRDLQKIEEAAQKSNSNQPLGNPQQSLSDAYGEDQVPMVYVSTVPAELLITNGQPQLTPILGTSLLYVSNSGNDIFMDTASNTYYVLLAGRWFSAASLQNGPWSYVAGTALPPDFAKIPTSNPKASVLVSVPGTPQAKEALIANSIPQTAAISRTGATLNVAYSGAPDFQPVQGTTLTYAANTATPVIYVPSPGGYYAVSKGVWFTSGAATGPWVVATSVPPAIYTIPVSSSLHYVTYVQVYGSTPQVVYVGYTPGYYGTVVTSDNVVVYGTGYNYVPYVTSTYWVPAPYTYGVGAGFGWSTYAGWGLAFGMGMAVGAYCSPWWGPVGYWGWGYAAPAWGWGGYGGAAAANVYGQWGHTAYAGTRAAWANPYTGNIGTGARGTYYNNVTGNSGYAAHGANYNAYTGNYRTGSAVSGYNPSTGRSYAGESGTKSNAYTGNYAAGARGAEYNQNTGVVHGGATGVAGNAYTGQSVAGSRGFSYNTNTGNGVAHDNGNVYADHDGNVYKASPSQGWQQHTSSGWSNPSSSFDRSQADNWQSARDQGGSRWGNFSSGGWGGGHGGGGWADRGGGFGGGGFRGGGFGGGGFRR
jgi:hypothetical protein